MPIQKCPYCLRELVVDDGRPDKLELGTDGAEPGENGANESSPKKIPWCSGYKDQPNPYRDEQ